MNIKVKTCQDRRKGGGGLVLTVFDYPTTGPKNLLRAVKAMAKKSTEDKVGPGNIGRGDIWLEIDGKPFHVPYNFRSLQDAREFLKEAAAGFHSDERMADWHY